MAASVETIGLVKRFGGITANDSVDFRAEAGEIHALLGENGAGKSTLLSMLSGLYKPDSGEIRLDGKPVRLSSPRAAMEHGIGIVHQRFRLVPTLTAVENIVLADRRPFWRGAGWKRATMEHISESARRSGLIFPVNRPVWQLSAGEQQRVEIMKLLYRGAETILLDEPTAVLTPQEAEQLYETLKLMTRQGKTVIVSTHKLNEVMAHADRISVMRKGAMIAELTPVETTAEALAQLLIGRTLSKPENAGEAKTGAPILKVEGLTVKGDYGHQALSDVAFTVHQGEIVGIAGVAGNGQLELAEALAGLRGALAGTVQFKGRTLGSASIRKRIEQGIGYIPENRMRSALAGPLGSTDNLLFKSYRVPERSRYRMMRNRLNERWSGSLVAKFEIKTPDLRTPVQQLSGGNQQKLVFARELDQEPELLIAMHPTQGLDAGAIHAVHGMLRGIRDSAGGVLLISDDLDELIELSDRIVVLYGGRTAGSFTASEADPKQIGLMMTGTETELAEETEQTEQTHGAATRRSDQGEVAG